MGNPLGANGNNNGQAEAPPLGQPSPAASPAAPRWDRDPFEGDDIGLGTPVCVYRRAPYACAGDFKKLFEHDGSHILTRIGRLIGDGTYYVTAREKRSGTKTRGRHSGFGMGGAFTLRGFGPPKLPWEVPSYDLSQLDEPSPEQARHREGAPMMNAVQDASVAAGHDPFVYQAIGQLTEQSKAMHEALRTLCDQRTQSTRERELGELASAVKAEVRALVEQHLAESKRATQQVAEDLRQLTRMVQGLAENLRGTPLATMEQAIQVHDNMRVMARRFSAENTPRVPQRADDDEDDDEDDADDARETVRKVLGVAWPLVLPLLPKLIARLSKWLDPDEVEAVVKAATAAASAATEPPAPRPRPRPERRRVRIVREPVPHAGDDPDPDGTAGT